MKYDNFFLGADNLIEAKKFYGEVLGLKPKLNFSSKQLPGMLAFHVGDKEPAIILKDKNIYPDIKPTIWFVVDDVKTEYSKLQDSGVTFLSEPFEIGTGLSVEFDDPFGNRLGLTDYTKKKG